MDAMTKTAVKTAVALAAVAAVQLAVFVPMVFPTVQDVGAYKEPTATDRQAAMDLVRQKWGEKGPRVDQR